MFVFVPHFFPLKQVVKGTLLNMINFQNAFLNGYTFWLHLTDELILFFFEGNRCEETCTLEMNSIFGSAPCQSSVIDNL